MFGKRQQKQTEQKGQAGKTLEELSKQTGKDYSKRAVSIREYKPVPNGWGKGGK